MSDDLTPWLILAVGTIFGFMFHVALEWFCARSEKAYQKESEQTRLLESVVAYHKLTGEKLQCYLQLGK